MASSKIVALLVLGLSTLAAVAQPAQYCSNIQAGSHQYDLSWWQGKGPFTKLEETGTYTFTFSLCSPLPTACPNTASASPSACGTPGSASMCQTWYNQQNPSQPYSACCANAKAVPTFTETVQGGDRGITMLVGGGDNCDICSPETRVTKYTIICDAATTPNIVRVDNADLPDPVFNVLIRHCSGCPTSDSRFCGAASSASVNFVASVVNQAAPLQVSLLPPPNTLTVDSSSGVGLKISGTIEQATNATVDFVISSTTGSTGIASLSFPGSQIGAISLRDVATGKSYPCNPPKFARSASVAAACTFGTYGVFVLQGSIL